MKKGFLLVEFAIYFVLFILLCQITFSAVHIFSAVHKRLTSCIVERYQLFNGVKILTEDIMQAEQDIAATANSLTFTRQTKIIWQLEHEKLYRIQDQAKNLIMQNIDSLHCNILKRDEYPYAVEVALSYKKKKFFWLIYLMNKVYEL